MEPKHHDQFQEAERVARVMDGDCMNSDLLNEARIIDSWDKNAAEWARVVQGRRIESRHLVTDQAIIDAVTRRFPHSVLDIGCGEGWLARALIASGVAVLGVDAIPSLVDCAKRSGAGDFEVLSFEEIAAGELKHSADVAVCNFSLFGKTSVERLFSAVPSILTGRGTLIVQTLHPMVARGGLPYRDGWRDGSWGTQGKFTSPAPWYFRTLASWISLFSKSGLQLLEVLEPLHPITHIPASVLFVANIDEKSAGDPDKPKIL
jgi:2-polyprenyl-3-methyl-5-hydroxy-6-metoxy-1,4-benzoquinol methylase